MKLVAPLISILVVASACDALVPQHGTCPVRVVNHLLPLTHDGAPEATELAPPYVAEMGWRYGGSARKPLADVRISGLDWGRAEIDWELIDPNGEVRFSGSVPSDEFRRGIFGLSLSSVGTWHYRLRALDERVDCERTNTIQVVPDSQRRAIDP